MSSTTSDCPANQQPPSADVAVCRDFLRNVCKRGRRCKFVHPTQPECEKIRRSERIFCHDFQNSVCRRPACKFLHYSREDEEIFRLTGHLPDEVDSKGDGSQATAMEESPPICKDYLNGICTRGPSCKYRHMSLANEKRTQCCSVTDAPSTFHDLFLDEMCVSDFVPVMCTAPPSQPILSTSLAVALQHPTMLTVPTSVPSHDRIQLTQSATLNTSIVSGQESVLTPVKDMYINSGAPPAPVVGVVDRVGLSSSNLQHTIYAHPSGLGTFTPLVSVSSSSQPVPCSSVLAVVAEPSQHPTILQHPNAVAASQTTYHLLSSTPASMQQQLLSSSSSVSSTPTLLTIPLPQFACNSTTQGAILASHASAECNAHQHPSVLANRALANASGTCFPSYNLLHINPTSAVETVPVFPGQHTLPEKVTTAVSSSTTAVLAAAAAAGYLAQHLPVITGATPVTPSDSGGGCGGNGPGTLNVRFGSQQDLMVERTPESAALAAAANLPAVSAAAAAAVAAAKVFAARTTGMPLSEMSYSAENSKCLSNSRDLNGPQRALKSEQSKTLANTDCSGDAFFMKKQTTSLHFPSCYPTSTATSTTTTSIASEVHVSTTSPPINSTPVSSSSSHYVHRTQQDEEDAKTAAAVAAAACIGAMFSQPLSGGGADSSSVAAMLGDLMGKNHLNLGHSTITQESPEVSRTSQFSSADASFQNTYVSLEEQFPCENSLATSHLNNLRKDVSLVGDVTSLQNSTDTTSITRCSEDNPNSLSDFQCHSFSNPRMDFANSSTWTSVATTVASAAQAAAAAAVAVTAAVTRSAKFFQLTRNQVAQQPSTPESALPRGRDLEHSHFADMDPQAREPSNTKSLLTATEPDRTTLSPNTAVTMTSAAAAAAMVAAAASAAAKQRRMFSGRRLQTYPDCIDLPYSSQPRLNLPPKDAYDAEDSEYSVACDTDRYAPPKRRMKIRAVTSKRYGYVRLRRDVALRETLEDDEDEEEPDVYEDDITLSPEVTPPYGIPAKQKRHSGQLSIMYNQNTDDSRPASCDTSPSETLETEPYSISRRSEAISTPCSSATFHSGECMHDLAVSCSRPRVGFPRDLFSFDQKDVVCSTSVQTSTSTIGRTQKPLSSVNIIHPVASVGSVVICPIPRLANFPRRSRSACSLSTFCCKPATPLRSKSLPPLPCIHNFPSVDLDVKSTQPESAIQCDIPKSSASSTPSVQQYPYVSTSQVIPARSESVERVPIKGCSESYRKRYRRPVPLVLSSSRRMLKLRRSKEISMVARGTNKIDSLVGKRRDQDRTPATASPDSVVNEDYSGHDDADDPEYVDTEDYDDDIFDLGTSETSIKRSRSLRAASSKPGKRKVNDLFASSGFSNFTYSSVSMRHQHALKAENVRLRRKLSDLMRQRGDLRAANEILLEQNARLRHSSKRVSAVARMAASATKIIEAHNKSQFAQPALSAPVFPSSSIHVTQSGNPFSLTQAAAAVVAAAQQQSNTPALHGVYVSSPTASITQPAPQAVAALAGGAHALFPSAVMAGAIPGTITLSSHQPLTTVQIQGSVDSLVPTSISTQSPAMIGQQSLASQQNTVRNFYHSQLHPIGSLPVSIANLAPHPNLATASSTIQVCHYPIPSSAAVFPTLPHSTAVSPSMMPIGTPNAVTLLVGPQPPPTAYTTVGSHPRLPSTLHLQGNLESKHASINVSPVSQFPSYVYQGSSSSGMLTTNATHLTNSVQNMDCFTPSTSKSSVPQHTVRRRMKKL